MKKIVLIILLIILGVGCTKVDELSYDDIFYRVVSSQIELTNQYRNGYKYYAPRGLRVKDNKESNEILANDLYNYYLYVDAISYFNNTNQTYQVDSNAYYSKAYFNNNIYGYLEINEVKDKYLVEMMYNYAKIEVIVDKENLNSTILNATTILSSIQYNYQIISSYMGEDALDFNEVEVNIFEAKKTESNIIKYQEKYGNYDENEEEGEQIPDPDLVR